MNEWMNNQPYFLFITQVCTQVLELPDGVSVASATMAAGHLSSSSIYPACFAPYLLSTACTDGTVRLWKCHVTEALGGGGVGEEGFGGIGSGFGSSPRSTGAGAKYQWQEWEGSMPSRGGDDAETAKIRVPGERDSAFMY